MSTTTGPVCGMKVDSESQHSVAHVGERYYFCSQHCLEKFQASPAKYLKPVVSAAIQAAGIYTCPMHPEVRQATPGPCPKCGMALEEGSPVALATGIVRPLQFGIGAFVFLLAIYFGVVSLISGMDFALEQFSTFWYFIVPLALGFGIQVGLFTYLKNLVGQHGASGKVVAVSGTTSTAAMVSCCAHYLTNILPILGVTGILAVVCRILGRVVLAWSGSRRSRGALTRACRDTPAGAAGRAGTKPALSETRPESVTGKYLPADIALTKVKESSHGFVSNSSGTCHPISA